MDLQLPEEEVPIRDKREKFKLKFPLFMMDIDAFRVQLDDAANVE